MLGHAEEEHAPPCPRQRVDRVDLLLWLTVFGLMLISLLRGLSGFGLAVAGNEARTFIPLAMATVWCWSRRQLPGFDRDLVRWGVVTGLALGVATAVALADVTGALEHQLGEELDRHGANIVVAPDTARPP